MNRIADIKERLHQLLPTTPYKITDHTEESFKWASNYQTDVEYLLSKLGVAEKALEEAKEKTALAVNKMCGGNVQQHVFEDTRTAYYSIKEALQQIRE